jgi:hypothetical protein
MVGPGMFDGLVTGIVFLLVCVFLLGIVLTLSVVWLWQYLPSIRLVW